MSTGWSVFVIVVTLGTLLACWLLLHLTSRSEVPDSDDADHGHSFDGITELENPLPRWWYWMFILTLVYALGYLLLYPGLGNFKGLLGWTSTGQWQEEVAAADARFGPLFAQYLELDVPAVAAIPAAVNMGGRLFGNSCAQCHGSGARGSFGFPNLTDDDWLWGGDPAAIRTSIVAGRTGGMPGWGAALGTASVVDMANRVRRMAGLAHDQASAARADSQYQTFCVACHAADGTGNQSLGAPDLTDDIWLYGGSLGELIFTINHGRQGRMPAHADQLDDARVHLLTAWVWQLSNRGSAVLSDRQTAADP